MTHLYMHRGNRGYDFDVKDFVYWAKALITYKVLETKEILSGE